MKRLSDIKGDEAFEVLADLLDPITEITADEEVKNLFKAGNKIRLISAILRKHKKQITEVMAILEGVEPESYKPTLVEIPVKLMFYLNDPAFSAFFTSQGQNQDENYFGSAMENTGETEIE